jgi:hypothetical protein
MNDTMGSGSISFAVNIDFAQNRCWLYELRSWKLCQPRRLAPWLSSVREQATLLIPDTSFGLRPNAIR